jgi:hypothetical protein
MFAFEFGEAAIQGFWTVVLFLLLGMWGIRRIAQQADKNGEVSNAARTAAKEGIVRVIGRLFK